VMGAIGIEGLMKLILSGAALSFYLQHKDIINAVLFGIAIYFILRMLGVIGGKKQIPEWQRDLDEQNQYDGRGERRNNGNDEQQ